MTLDPETDLKLERVVDAPRDLLWLCWTTPEHIKNFFIPAPHKVIECDLDLRVGGRFNTVFEVDGQRMDNRGVFLEIDPGKKLVFTDGYTEGWKPAEKPFMTAILLLEDVGEGKTRYTAIARHPTKEIREQHEQMGFFEGWNIVIDQLNDLALTLRAAGRCGPWRDEQLAVCAVDGRRLATVERGAARVLGLATIAADVTPELALASIESITVLGALHAPAAVKAALAARLR